MFSIILFILWILIGFFAALWNNQLSELRNVLMAAPSKNTMISNKVMAGMVTIKTVFACRLIACLSVRVCHGIAVKNWFVYPLPSMEALQEIEREALMRESLFRSDLLIYSQYSPWAELSSLSVVHRGSRT